MKNYYYRYPSLGCAAGFVYRHQFTILKAERHHPLGMTITALGGIPPEAEAANRKL